jgi:hypothetical protein
MADKRSAGPPRTGVDEKGLQEMVQRAEQGDTSALRTLQEALGPRSPFWRRYAELALDAEAAWLQLAGGDNLVLAEGLKSKLTELKADLGGPSSSPLERLLIERAALCWLETQCLDAVNARQGEGDRLPHLRSLLRAAHGRFTASLRALAVCRRHLAS